MATIEVPGYCNADTLRAGCWAEGPGGRLLVNGVGENVVSFSEYAEGESRPMATATVPLLEFQKSKSNGDWLWHDKTPWPEVA